MRKRSKITAFDKMNLCALAGLIIGLWVSSLMNPILRLLLEWALAGLIVICLSIILFRMLRDAYISQQAEAREEQNESSEEDPYPIPKRYTIGDDGQIVELKKPRKRPRNPHQR